MAIIGNIPYFQTNPVGGCWGWIKTDAYLDQGARVLTSWPDFVGDQEGWLEVKGSQSWSEPGCCKLDLKFRIMSEDRLPEPWDRTSGHQRAFPKSTKIQRTVSDFIIFYHHDLSLYPNVGIINHQSSIILVGLMPINHYKLILFRNL